MKKFICVAAVFSLAGCGEQYGESTGEGVMLPGIYQVTQPDGTVTRMVFKKDGDYFDMADNTPKPVDEGKWKRDGEQLCFISVHIDATHCFTEQARGDDGSFTLTGEGDRVSEFRPVAVPGLEPGS